MLRAGFARVDITPPPECSLLGYEFRATDLPTGHAGVNDPLLASALALQADGDDAPAILVSVDLCVVSDNLCRHLRTAIADAAHTQADRVILACTHTHSGPLPMSAEDARKWEGFLARFIGPGQAGPGQDYAAQLEIALREAAAEAAGLMVPVTVGTQQAPLGLAYNRRVMTDAGVQHCWNPQESPDLSPGPAPDPTCTVLSLRQPDGPRQWLLWSLGAHPVVLGKTSRVVSADWPGAARRHVERSLPGAVSVFLQGAAGNAHPWVATQADPAGVETVGGAAGAFVTLLAQATRRSGEGDRLATAARTVEIGGVSLDLAAWRIGGAILLAVPVELFGELGAEVRRRLDRPVLLATCANGWAGYWPTVDAFEQGGYEVDGAGHKGLSAGDGEKLVEAMVDLAGSLG